MTLQVIRGETKNRTIGENLATRLDELGVSGDLYLGYPVLASADERVHVDALLASPDHECRIACATPFRIGRFLDFVFRTFYPSLYSSNPYLAGFTKEGWFDSDIADVDRDRIHFSWT